MDRNEVGPRDPLREEIRRMALEAIEIASDEGVSLDPEFAEGVRGLEEAVVRTRRTPLSERGRLLCVQRYGCYLLEVAQTAYPEGMLGWSTRFEQPVFQWSSGHTHVSMLAWRKVEGLLGGDDGDSLVFHWEGVCEAIAARSPGDKIFV
jgi:hypothetical protein